LLLLLNCYYYYIPKLQTQSEAAALPAGELEPAIMHVTQPAKPGILRSIPPNPNMSSWQRCDYVTLNQDAWSGRDLPPFNTLDAL
jgi:hypothetical protein